MRKIRKNHWADAVGAATFVLVVPTGFAVYDNGWMWILEHPFWTTIPSVIIFLVFWIRPKFLRRVVDSQDFIGFDDNVLYINSAGSYAEIQRSEIEHLAVTTKSIEVSTRHTKYIVITSGYNKPALNELLVWLDAI